MAKLRGIDENDGSHVATDLAKHGKEAMPYLIRGLASSDVATRQWCARAMCDMLDEFGESAGRAIAAAGSDALLQALDREKNPRAMWLMVQAVGTIRPAAQQSLPVLIRALERGEREAKEQAVEAIGAFGAQAVTAKPALWKALESNDEWLQSETMSALDKIGQGKEDYATLSRLNVADRSEGAQLIFDHLLSEPDLAVAFVEKHPQLLAALPKDHPPLVELFSRKDKPRDKLREYLLRQKQLPEFIRIDRDRGENYGFVMTWPTRAVGCFPQRTRMIMYVGETAQIGAFATNPEEHVWFEDDLAQVAREGKWGFVDRAGKIVIAPQFEHTENFSEGFAVVWEGKKAGYIRKDGTYLKRPEFEWAYWFKHGLGSVKQHGKFGLIDTKGDWVLPPTYDGSLTPFDSGFSASMLNGREVELDKKGKVIKNSSANSAEPPVNRFRRRRR
ncbi:MAG: WG repeat-containing protein [Planctomycetia bacterium]|nr:WG repeat-containing protein [Planctomycetia bacterium]